MEETSFFCPRDDADDDDDDDDDDGDGDNDDDDDDADADDDDEDDEDDEDEEEEEEDDDEDDEDDDGNDKSHGNQPTSSASSERVTTNVNTPHVLPAWTFGQQTYETHGQISHRKSWRKH